MRSLASIVSKLKAALASRDIAFPYTHDLDGLTELCRTHRLDVPGTLEGVEQLAPYGVHLRYGASHISSLDRDQALGWATAAIAWAQSVIDLTNGGSAQPDAEHNA
jgi:hypothetical protein